MFPNLGNLLAEELKFTHLKIAKVDKHWSRLMQDLNWDGDVRTMGKFGYTDAGYMRNKL